MFTLPQRLLPIKRVYDGGAMSQRISRCSITRRVGAYAKSVIDAAGAPRYSEMMLSIRLALMRRDHARYARHCAAGRMSARDGDALRMRSAVTLIHQHGARARQYMSGYDDYGRQRCYARAARTLCAALCARRVIVDTTNVARHRRGICHHHHMIINIIHCCANRRARY